MDMLAGSLDHECFADLEDMQEKLDMEVLREGSSVRPKEARHIIRQRLHYAFRFEGERALQGYPRE